MDKLIIPLAYRYVALALMLAEINYISDRLQLPVDRPITPQEFQMRHVSNPFLSGFGGTLETDKFSFVFYKSGILRRITRLNAFEKLPLRELQWKQSRMVSLINSNQAYQLATNWLVAVSVDVAALGARYHPSVEQTFFYPDATDLNDPPEKRKRVILLPIFHIAWGDPRDPAIIVSVFGPTKELLALHQNDDSFSRRPRDLISNVNSLLGIADAEFVKLSVGNRRQLISKFAKISYTLDPSTNDFSIEALSPSAGNTRKKSSAREIDPASGIQ